MEDDKEEEKKEIEVVTGDDSELDISNVYDHLNFDKVRENPEKQNIIIPGIIKEEILSSNTNSDESSDTDSNKNKDEESNTNLDENAENKNED